MRKLYSLFVLLLTVVTAWAQAVDVTPARYVIANQAVGQYTLDNATTGANPTAKFAAAVTNFNDGYFMVNNGQMANLSAPNVVNLQSGMNIVDMGGNVGKVLALKGHGVTAAPDVPAATAALTVGWFNLSYYMAPESVAVDETVRFQVVFQIQGGAGTLAFDAYTYENNNKGATKTYGSADFADTDTWQQVEFDYSASNADNLPLRLAMLTNSQLFNNCAVLIRSIKMTKSPEGQPETKTLSAATDFKQEPQAPAYKKVRLQFSETNANGTTVSVVDENGEPIEGASATLEAIEKQDGQNDPVSTTLQTQNAHLLTPVYNNSPGNGWVLTFKLQGLQGQFNKALVDLHAMNAGGGYQNDANIKYWTANLSTGTSLEEMTDFGTSERYGISDPKYQDGSTRHVEATIPGSEVAEFAEEMYVKLHVVKVEGGGCFCGIQYLDFPMFNPDAKFTTITWNLKDSEGNIKATDTHENCEEGTEVSAQFAYPFLTIDGETTTTAGKEDQTIDLTYTENYPFAVTTDATSPVYGKLHGHSNQNRYIYLTEEGMGHDTTTEPEEFTDNYMWYITGNCFDGFQLWNKAFPGQPLKATTPVASVNEESEASSLWELREGKAGSKFAEVGHFALWQESVTYLNCQGDLKYWQNADEGSTFYFEEEIPEPENPFTVDFDGIETITITPKDPEATYFLGIANDAIMGLQSYTNVYDFYDDYLLPNFWEEDMCTGVSTMTDTYYSSTWHYGLTEGLNYILVANGYWDPEAYEGEGGAVRTGDIYVYEITTGEPTGVGTVLNQQASKAAYDLQGKLVNKLQRGIMIQNGKKVLR